METGQGSSGPSGLRQAGGGLGVTMVGSSSNPRFLGDFGSFVLFSVGFNMVQWSQMESATVWETVYRVYV